jgi:hypothetical protein
MRHSERSLSSGEARNLPCTNALVRTAQKLKMKPKFSNRKLRIEN